MHNAAIVPTEFGVHCVQKWSIRRQHNALCVLCFNEKMARKMYRQFCAIFCDLFVALFRMELFLLFVAAIYPLVHVLKIVNIAANSFIFKRLWFEKKRVFVYRKCLNLIF